MAAAKISTEKSLTIRRPNALSHWAGIGQVDFKVAACLQVPETPAGKLIPNYSEEIVSLVFSVILVNAKILHLVAENTTGYPESVCSLRSIPLILPK